MVDRMGITTIASDTIAGTIATTTVGKEGPGAIRAFSLPGNGAGVRAYSTGRMEGTAVGIRLRGADGDYSSIAFDKWVWLARLSAQMKIRRIGEECELV
jgi:hypothetical protein